MIFHRRPKRSTPEIRPLPECNWQCLNFSFLASNHPHRCTSVSNRPHDLGPLLAPIPSPAAAVFLAIAAAMLAAVVEHPLADVLPHRVQPVEADGVEALDLDDAEASQAFDAQQLRSGSRRASSPATASTSRHADPIAQRPTSSPRRCAPALQYKIRVEIMLCPAFVPYLLRHRACALAVSSAFACFGVGNRQSAGRLLVIPRENIKRTSESSSIVQQAVAQFSRGPG